MMQQKEKTIGDILPAVDDFVNVYQKHRGLIGMTLGNVKISQINQIVDMVKGFQK